MNNNSENGYILFDTFYKGFQMQLQWCLLVLMLHFTKRYIAKLSIVHVYKHTKLTN